MKEQLLQLQATKEMLPFWPKQLHLLKVHVSRRQQLKDSDLQSFEETLILEKMQLLLSLENQVTSVTSPFSSWVSSVRCFPESVAVALQPSVHLLIHVVVVAAAECQVIQSCHSSLI